MCIRDRHPWKQHRAIHMCEGGGQGDGRGDGRGDASEIDEYDDIDEDDAQHMVRCARQGGRVPKRV
eukprot:7894752-Alexandrium_andersonii.AAC.1